MLEYRSCFTLSGGRAEGENGKWHSIGLVAANSVTAFAATQRRAWEFVDGLWGQPVPTGKYRYYDGMLLMFGLLHLSGNFKIYMPGYYEKVAAEKAAAKKAATEAAAAAASEKAAADAAASAEGEKAEGEAAESEEKAAEDAAATKKAAAESDAKKEKTVKKGEFRQKKIK
jgi:hypothetical protein